MLHKLALFFLSGDHKLNLRVIAEGVESEQQCNFLRDNDCDEMQGYLFSMPVPASKIHSLLAEQARMLAEVDTMGGAPGAVHPVHAA